MTIVTQPGSGVKSKRTRIRFAWVAVLFIVATTAWAEPPAEPPDEATALPPTRGALIDAIRSGRHADAVAIGRRLLESTPAGRGERGWVLYNVACAQALDGQPDAAVKSLEAALADGYAHWIELATDADFDSLRGHAGFRKLLDGLRTTDVVDVETQGLAAQDVRSLLVVLHPSGSHEAANREDWLALAKATDAVLVAPRAPLTIAPGHFSWVADPTDFAPAIACVERAVERSGVAAPVTVVGVGWRAGDLAWRYALARPDRVERVVLLDGRFDRFASRRTARGKLGGGVWFVVGAAPTRNPRASTASAGEGLRLLLEEGFTALRWTVGSGPNPLSTATRQLADRLRSAD